jgi:hypothetical protein
MSTPSLNSGPFERINFLHACLRITGYILWASHRLVLFHGSGSMRDKPRIDHRESKNGA